MIKSDMILVDILEKIYHKLNKEINEAYYNGTIDDVLLKYGLQDEIEYYYYDKSNSKILIIGHSMINKNDMINIARQYGINESKLEFKLDYKKLSNYDFSILKNNMNYSDILVGPMPHSVRGINSYSSFLVMTEREPESFPKITKLKDANELKITKETFKKAILNTRLYNDLYC